MDNFPNTHIELLTYHVLLILSTVYHAISPNNLEHYFSALQATKLCGIDVGPLYG